MGLRNYNKDFFKDKERIKNTKKSSSKRLVNGVLVEPNSKNFKVQNAAQILKQNNVYNKQNNNNDTASIALETLAAIGVTPVKEQNRDFSFLNSQDMLTPENPNIVDENRLKNLKNKTIKADDKFKDSSNPFYNLDDSISENKRKQIQKSKNNITAIDTTNVVVAIFDLNIVNNNKPLRQFR